MSSAEESPAPSQQLGLGRHFMEREDAGEECGPAVPSLGTAMCRVCSHITLSSAGTRQGLGSSLQQSRGGDAHTQQVFALAASPLPATATALPAWTDLPDPGTTGITCKRSHPEPCGSCLELLTQTPQRAEIGCLEKLRCLDPSKKHLEGVLRRLCQLRKGPGAVQQHPCSLSQTSGWAIPPQPCSAPALLVCRSGQDFQGERPQ